MIINFIALRLISFNIQFAFYFAIFPFMSCHFSLPLILFHFYCLILSHIISACRILSKIILYFLILSYIVIRYVYLLYLIESLCVEATRSNNISVTLSFFIFHYLLIFISIFILVLILNFDFNFDFYFDLLASQTGIHLFNLL